MSARTSTLAATFLVAAGALLTVLLDKDDRAEPNVLRDVTVPEQPAPPTQGHVDAISGSARITPHLSTTLPEAAQSTSGHDVTPKAEEGAQLDNESLDLLTESFELLYRDASQAELRDALQAVNGRVLQADFLAAHEAQFQAERFEVIGQVRLEGDLKIVPIPSEVSKTNLPFLTNTRETKDGRVVRTHILPSDIPWSEHDIREAVWIHKELVKRATTRSTR